MKEYQGLVFEQLEENNIEILTPIMERAFDDDTKRHTSKDKGRPPGYDNRDFLRKWALHDDSTAYKIWLYNELGG